MLLKDNHEYETPNANARGETVISADAAFKGSISFQSSLRIDGKFEGEISSKGTLVVGKTGLVKAEIKVGNMVVEGKIQGNVQADERIELRSNAQLFGDIKANTLMMAEGVSFVGKCNVNPNNEKVEGLFSKEPALDLGIIETKLDLKKEKVLVKS